MLQGWRFRQVRSMALLGLGGSLLIAGVTACSGTWSVSAKRGRSLYTFHCYSCHEENQLGLLKVPPKLHRIFSHTYLPDGTTPATDESVREVIIHGKRTMPPFDGRLSNDQINDILAFLHRN
jgi:mono/diheme cytochrome c family protein